MARIFLSHSSANNAEAIAVRDWLIAQGWDDLFLDVDPQRGLKAGERWQAALKQAAERCEVVIFLVSPAWAASRWCVAEFLLAKQLNKRIFGVVIEPVPLADLPTEMTAEWQMVNLTAGAREHRVTVKPPPGDKAAEVAFANDGLEQLRIGLMQAGLEARYFAWPPEGDPERAPYRGLRPLEAEDAGIFFGRDGPIVLGLDLLRGLREAPPPRLVVILGASGAGKSSFLRAGLWPRLAREDQHFLPLPVIRPERAALTGESGLIAALEGALKGAGIAHTRADIRSAVAAGASGIAPLLAALVHARTAPLVVVGPEVSKPPTLILCVDQAEELFLAEAGEEARAFLQLLRDLTTQDAPALIALFTIRSDCYERLQTAKELGGVRQHMLSLPPMPQGEYAEVIRGPARRLEGSKRPLKVEGPLVSALLSDIEVGGAKDALPLLAFTLERLYAEYHGGGHLKLEHYEQLGRVQGSIEAAVERAFTAADADPRIPRDKEARLALLRRGLIPWLAGIDPDTGAPRRRVARISEIPTESRPLVDLLVNQRLLSTDVSKKTGEKTIEPVHEALLRQWGLLAGWLKQDTALLSVMDGVKRASRDWSANLKGPAWITHTTGRLRAAERLVERPDLAANLEPTDRDYLAACGKAEREAQNARRRIKGLVCALALLLAAGGVGWWRQDFLQDQYGWRVVMGGSGLTVEQEIEKAAKPGSDFRECARGCPTMVIVPAGKFLMGSVEGKHTYDEHPQHEVTIAKPFAVGKYELKFSEWDTCAAAGACPMAPDSGWGRGDRPVINVSWDNAKQYVAWLSRISGKPYRLLTEAEWEYVARAGTTTGYAWGDDIGRANANCGGCGGQWDRKQTAPVGSFKPNAFGLYDMHGNVGEWVEDHWHWPNYEGAPSDGSAWILGGDTIRRVVRGGSWSDDIPDRVRSAYREQSDTETRNSHFGFRIARTLAP